MRISLFALLFSCCPLVLSRSTAVRKTGHGPTGYVVDFVFHSNSTRKPASVLLGGIPLFSDALNASPSRTSGFSPYNWKPDQFPLALFPTGDVNQDTYAGFNMTWNQATNDWEITLPLPSGTYQYAFYPDCHNITNNCLGVVDENNPPLAPTNDDQMFSTVQVPFNRRYQYKNYDYQLPIQNPQARGSVQYFDYPSPGSTYPSPNVHSAGVYLPAGYQIESNRTYPVLYLHHGGGGNDSDWFNLARAHHIMDHLVAGGYIEPTVVVTPNFYDLGFTIEELATDRRQEGFDVEGLNAFYLRVRDSYLAHLLPWVEATFRVGSSPSQRAFAGLSLGGGLTATMLFNATSTFSAYNVMSNIPFPAIGDRIYENPGLRSVSIFLGAGFYDIAFQNSRNSGQRLDAAGLKYQNYYFPDGGHQWSSWQEILWVWGKTNFWKAP